MVYIIYLWTNEIYKHPLSITELQSNYIPENKMLKVFFHSKESLLIWITLLYDWIAYIQRNIMAVISLSSELIWFDYVPIPLWDKWHIASFPQNTYILIFNNTYSNTHEILKVTEIYIFYFCFIKARGYQLEHILQHVCSDWVTSAGKNNAKCA